MRPDEWDAVAELIHVSTNAYYTSHGMGAIFSGDPGETTRLFCEVYEDLDPGCCLVAEHPVSGRLTGSCFYHPRDTHYALGIMNVHPSYFGQGIARSLLNEILARADADAKPTRLVSSALNLDSYSLYSRAGFVPHTVFQDTLLTVPEDGYGTVDSHDRVRKASLDDLEAIVSLEEQVAGIRRPADWAYFVENRLGVWHVTVSVDSSGAVDGVLASIGHPGSRIVGPGVAKDEDVAVDLITAELDVHRGQTVLLLVPVLCRKVLETVAGLRGRTSELHFAQCRGSFQPYDGVVIPTFMPETG